MEETPLEAAQSFAAPSKRKINKRFIYFLIALVIFILLFFGFNLLGQNKEQSINDITAITTPTEMPTSTPEITPSSSPTPSPTKAPTPTPKPKPTSNPIDSSTGLDRSELSVTIQNGSGEAGVAGKASDILKQLGYSVSGSGNADNFDYISVSIQVKSAKSAFLNLLKKDLVVNYTIGSNSADLSTSFSSDALVIIGK